jgi:protoporphyrinogen/coproporphyrinogen III oxidase
MNPYKEPKKVAIIGGGISGLAAAYTLQEQARSQHQEVAFTLFESSSNLGGKIITEKADGFVIEGGPDSFIQQKPWAMQMAQQLGLEPSLMGTNREKHPLYVVNRGQMTPMPDGVLFIIPTRFMPFITSPLISWPGKIRMGMELFIPPYRGDKDESIGHFIRRRLGKEALEKIAAPLMSGIHVSDPEKQSLLSTFPRFRNLEKKYGSLIRGMLAQQRSARSSAKNQPSIKNQLEGSPFLTFKEGMRSLITALENHIDESNVRTDCRVSKLRPLPHGGFEISTSDNETHLMDAVILATPAYVSAQLVSTFTPTLARELNSIRYVSTATVSLAFRLSDLRHPFNGIGFIIPQKEKHSISACTCSSIKFSDRAPENYALYRFFMGGPGHEADVELDDQEIVRAVRTELSKLMDIQAEPVLTRIYRWIKGNPQYDIGHQETVNQIQTISSAIPGLFLTGSAYEGVGVPDCIHQGQQAAEKTISFLMQKESLKTQQKDL